MQVGNPRLSDFFLLHPLRPSSILPPMSKQLLTNSRLRAFRTCARLHSLRYIKGWQVVRTSEALRVGSLVHLGLEAWWTGKDPMVAVAGRAIDAYEQAKVEEMLLAYANRWGADRDLYEVLGIELEFRAPLLNPETMAESRTWELAGKLDGLLRRKSDGRVLVMEHKTTQDDISDEASDYWLGLAMDGQISQYILGAESMGHKVDEVLYDVLRKPAIRPLTATPPESRKYKADGSLYANQRDRDESPEEYRMRLREVLADPKYLARHSVPRTLGQMEEFLFDAWEQSSIMRESERLDRAPRNPEACNRMGRCAFWQVCSTGSKPEDFPADYIKSEKVNPELEV